MDYQEFKAMIFRYKARKEEEGISEADRRNSKEKKKRKKDVKNKESTNAINNNFGF